MLNFANQSIKKIKTKNWKRKKKKKKKVIRRHVGLNWPWMMWWWPSFGSSLILHPINTQFLPFRNQPFATLSGHRRRRSAAPCSHRFWKARCLAIARFRRPMDKVFSKLRNLDAYPKVNEDFYSRTLAGGVVTVVSAAVMLFLFFSELSMIPCSLSIFFLIF